MKKNGTKLFLLALLKATVCLCALTNVHNLQAAKSSHESLEWQLEETIGLLEKNTKQLKSKSTTKALQELAKISREILAYKKLGTLTSEHLEHGMQLAHRSQEKVLRESCSHCNSLFGLVQKIFYVLTDFRNNLIQEIEELSEHLECLQRIVIDRLPITITESGSYCVKKSLLFEVPSPAITVAADNVDIDLGDHTITVGPAAAAIFAQNTTNLRIHNGQLESTLPSTDPNSIGISLVNVDHAEFNDIIFSNTLIGYSGAACTDQSFANCKFNHPGDTQDTRGIEIFGGAGYTIERCFFDTIGQQINGNSGIAIDVNVFNTNTVCNTVTINECDFTNTNSVSTSIFLVGTTNVEITDCKMQNNGSLGNPSSAGIAVVPAPLTNSSFASPTNITIQNCDIDQPHSVGIAATSFDNLLIENCRIQSNDNTLLHNVIVGASNPAFSKTNAILRNCSLSNPNAAGGFVNLLVTNIEGGLIENCTLDSNGLANLHIGLAPSNNVKVLNSTFSKTCLDHVRITDNSSSITVENCNIDASMFAGVHLLNATECTIKNCEISNVSNGYGIFLEPNSNFNQILDNAITQCNFDGIVINSTNNTIKYNTCSNNGSHGINNGGGATNEFYFNTACHNSGTPANNCFGITPSGLVQPPGGTNAPGVNVCCTSP